jgi:hypothetical protein
MEIERDDVPLWQINLGDFIRILRNELCSHDFFDEPKATPVVEERWVYGIDGIAKLFNCSRATAWKIKKSGRIDQAVKQIGRKIVVDAQLALELIGRKGGRNGAK